MSSGRIVIAGGSGFIGRSIAPDLVAQGYKVVVLTRGAARRAGAIRYVQWDGRTLGSWAAEIDGARAVINLTGKSVNCRYTPKARDEINQSRMCAVRIMHEAIAQCQNPPKVLVQASSLPIYGDAGDRICDETAPPGMGFPVETCLLWEHEFNAVPPTPHTRRVLVRIGFVLGSEGGVLRTLAGLTRCFLGGTVGSGKQFISWLHVRDLGRIFAWAIENESASGIFNACTRNPVRNAEFMAELRRALRRPWSPPTPPWAVRFGSWLIRTEPCLALTGRRAMPKRLIEMGFRFAYPELRAALQDIFPRRRMCGAISNRPMPLGG